MLWSEAWDLMGLLTWAYRVDCQPCVSTCWNLKSKHTFQGPHSEKCSTYICTITNVHTEIINIYLHLNSHLEIQKQLHKCVNWNPVEILVFFFDTEAQIGYIHSSLHVQKYVLDLCCFSTKCLYKCLPICRTYIQLPTQIKGIFLFCDLSPLHAKVS